MALDLLCNTIHLHERKLSDRWWTESLRAWKASCNKVSPGQTTLAFFLSQPFLNVMSLRHSGLLLSTLSSWICEESSVTLLKLQRFPAWTCWTAMWLFRSSPEPLRGIVEEYFNNLAGCNETATSVFEYFKWKCLLQAHFHFQMGNMSQRGGDPETRLSLISWWLDKHLRVSLGTWHLLLLLLGRVFWKSPLWNPDFGRKSFLLFCISWVTLLRVNFTFGWQNKKVSEIKSRP